MTVSTRRSKVIKAGLLLLIVYLVLNSMPTSLHTLSLDVSQSNIKRVELLVDDRVHASVVFDVLPNHHSFELPTGEYTLLISRLDGSRETRRVNLTSEMKIALY